MNRTTLLACIALLISLGTNAWQYSRRAEADRRAAPGTRGFDPTTHALQRRATGSPGGMGPDARSSSQAGGRDSDGQAPESQPPGTLAEILAMPEPIDRIDGLLGFAKNLPADRIGDMLEQLRAGTDRRDPEARLLADLLLKRWTQQDPDAALASLNGLSANEAGEDAVSILSTLAADDPARAVEWLADPANQIGQDPYFAYNLARTIATQWAVQDPDAALEWAASLPDDRRGGAYSGILGNLAATDPQRAASLAMEVPAGDRGKLMGEIAERWALQAPEAAVAWASSLEGADRTNAMPEALGAWARTAPSEAAAFVDQLPEDQRAEQILPVAKTWSQRAPSEAAAWLGTQPESTGKAYAMGYLMWDWTNADSPAAATWLGEQAAGESYDQGVAGLAKAATHVYQDAEAGVAWAVTIKNEQLRNKMIRNSLAQWLHQDPQAASAWAAQNGIELAGGEAGAGQ